MAGMGVTGNRLRLAAGVVPLSHAAMLAAAIVTMKTAA